jgi:hypothetical protein
MGSRYHWGWCGHATPLPCCRQACPSVKVKGCSDRRRKDNLLVPEQRTNLLTQSLSRHSGHVVAAHNGWSVQTVRLIDRHLRRKASDRRRDRRHRNGCEMRAHELASQNQHRPGLVELRNVNRTHQASLEGKSRAYSARPASSSSGPVRARISASRAAIVRRRSRSSALVTTAARLCPAPETTASSTKATSSSDRRTAIWMLIPEWYHIGTMTLPMTKRRPTPPA